MAFATHITLPPLRISTTLGRVNKPLITTAVQMRAYGKSHCSIFFKSLGGHCDLVIATPSKCAISKSLFLYGNVPFGDVDVSQERHLRTILGQSNAKLNQGRKCGQTVLQRIYPYESIRCSIILARSAETSSRAPLIVTSQGESGAKELDDMKRSRADICCPRSAAQADHRSVARANRSRSKLCSASMFCSTSSAPSTTRAPTNRDHVKGPYSATPLRKLCQILRRRTVCSENWLGHNPLFIFD